MEASQTGGEQPQEPQEQPAQDSQQEPQQDSNLQTPQPDQPIPSGDEEQARQDTSPAAPTQGASAPGGRGSRSGGWRHGCGSGQPHSVTKTTT
jgi:hypothetical protein